MSVSFSISGSRHSGGRSVTAVIDGETYITTDRNPRFNEIVEGLRNLDGSVADLFNEEEAINDALSELTDRVEVRDGQVFIDNRPAPRALSETIVRLHNEGNGDYARFVRFLERLSENPSFRSRDQLFAFVEANGIHLNADGHLVLYKGVRWDDQEQVHTSLHRGRATVDGEEVNGHIPARPGSVITMERRDISDDPNVACHVGLHCGAWGYASAFGGGNTITVVVDPADVVCVPNDHSHQKVRVCRYAIQGVETEQRQRVAWESDEDFEEEDEDDRPEYYGFF